MLNSGMRAMRTSRALDAIQMTVAYPMGFDSSGPLSVSESVSGSKPKSRSTGRAKSGAPVSLVVRTISCECSAAWMYRAWVEEILGLKVRGDRMQLDPVIPG